jgi:hypothetical protein
VIFSFNYLTREGRSMRSKVQHFLILISFFGSQVFALSGTGGTPLGGMGTGYVIYNGDKFSVSGKMPPAGADHCKGTPEKSIASSGFHILAGGTPKSPAKSTVEDAKCPLHLYDFGTVGGVKFNLNAFGPYLPGEGKENYQLATSPLAYFDMIAVNSGAAAVEVAVAMEFANGGLLGGAAGGTIDGTQAISFAGTADNAYLAVDCDGTTPAFSAGAIGTFATDGKLSNAAGNLVGAKCSIAAGATVHFKFVLAWYRDYESEDYYYHNFYTSSKEAATFGLSKFDAVRNGITSFVSRTLASNFPDWYKDRLLNNTYPLIHNSVCAKDGRVAFWEGNYGIIGTLDQGQHAAVFYSFNWPSVQWHELQYWARQQKSSGQIHHDFNKGVQSFTAGSSGNSRHLLAWDDKTHADYWWFSNTDSWADLNCMFIFKAYELMLATGDLDSVKLYWPAVKKAADRLLSQCAAGSKLPLQSHSTYDRCNGAADATGSNCSKTPEYNGGLAITTYLAMAEMAKFCGDNATATTFYENFKTAKAEYKQMYATSSTYGVSASVANSGRFPEGHIAGYSWANYLCLEPIMDSSFIAATCKKMRDKQQSGGLRANGEWVFYCVDHYGGSEIAINMADAAMTIHKQDYDYYYKSVPAQVHWQSLQESSGNTGHDSYMTAPVVWHSYFQFCGYMIDNANKRLWIRPRIPTEMNGEIKNALLLNPKALGTLNYKESSSADPAQTISVSYDAPVPVKEIMLKNNTGIESPFVVVNGAVVSNVKAEGSGCEKNIRVTFDAPVQIGPEGMTITVHRQPVGTASKYTRVTTIHNALLTASMIRGKSVYFSVASTGRVTIEALSLNGAKIGTVYRNNLSAGWHSFNWSGKTLDGSALGNNAIVLRLVTSSGSIARSAMLIE